MSTASNFCSNINLDPAVAFVSSGHGTFIDLAQRSFNLASSQANSLGNALINPVAFNVSFDFNDQLTPFMRPARPAFDLAKLDFNTPPAVAEAPLFSAQPVDIIAIPSDAPQSPSLAFPDRPNAPTIQAPTAPPAPANLVIPDAPDMTLPAPPTLAELNIPAVPDVVLPLFDGERPQFVEPPLNENWHFDPTAYISALDIKVRDTVSAMIDGGTALPDAIERALFERGASRITIDSEREVAQAVDEFVSRGFQEPNGILTKRIARVRQGGQDKRAELNRDLTIQFHTQRIETIKFAVQQGLVYEQAHINLHLEEQRLALEAGKFMQETAIAIFNARVSVFNAKLNAYQTDAQVLTARIQAALAGIEVFKAQIDGERIRGEINQQRVNLYVAQVQGVNALADVFKSRIEAVKAQSEIEQQVIERFRAEVQAFGDRWRAFSSEVEGYRAAVDAEGNKATIFDTLTRAFATRVTAAQSQQTAIIDRERLRIDQHGQSLNAWRGDLDRMLGLLQAEQQRVSAQGASFDAQARVYTADAAVEQAASASSDRSFELGLEREKAQTETQLKVAEIKIQENIQLLNLMIDIRKTLAQVMSQLAASSMSAVNYSAGISSSRSDSTSCGTSLSFSGEAADLT
jgi:hypothetical protein